MNFIALHKASALRISGGAIRSLTVHVDQARTGSIALDMRADDERETAVVDVRTKGRTLTVDVPSPNDQVYRRTGFFDRIFGRRKIVQDDLVGNRSGQGRDNRPTLDLTIHLPSGSPVRLDLSGQTIVKIGNVMGSLRLGITGSVQVDAGIVLDARVDGAGDCRVGIAAAQGDLRLDLKGSVRVGVARVQDGNLTLRSSGACKVEVEGGEFGEADVHLTGAGVAEIGALIARDLTFDGTGAFKAEFGQVIGQSETTHTGSGTIRVGGRRLS